jgi:arylsulfatase A-like enzyme
VRQGNWKAVRTHIKDSQPERCELFNLASDPGEKMDLAGQHPEIVHRLRELMTRSRQPHPSLNFKNP